MSTAVRQPASEYSRTPSKLKQSQAQQPDTSDMNQSRGVRLLHQSSSKGDLNNNNSQNLSNSGVQQPPNPQSQAQAAALTGSTTAKDRNYIPQKKINRNNSLSGSNHTRSNSYLPTEGGQGNNSPYSRTQTEAEQSPRQGRFNATTGGQQQQQQPPMTNSYTPSKPQPQQQQQQQQPIQQSQNGYSPRPIQQSQYPQQQQYKLQQQPQPVQVQVQQPQQGLTRQNSYSGGQMLIPPPPPSVLVSTTITQPAHQLGHSRLQSYSNQPQPQQQQLQVPSQSPSRQQPFLTLAQPGLPSQRTPTVVTTIRPQQPYTSPFQETMSARDRSPFNLSARGGVGQFNGTQTSHSRGGSASKLPKSSQVRLDSVLAKSQDDTREIIEDALGDETTKLRQEIEFLQQKLKLKDDEVNMYTQYVSNAKADHQQQQNNQLSPQRQYQSPLKTQTQTQFPQFNGHVTTGTTTVRSTAFYQPQSTQNSVFPPVPTQTMQRSTSRGHFDIPVQVDQQLQSSSSASNSQWQNQQLQLKITALEKQYQGVKQQLEERDQLVIRQQEEIRKLQRRPAGGVDDQADRIRKLEQENELYILKIQSLERNFLHVEKEYRLLKEKQGYY